MISLIPAASPSPPDPSDAAPLAAGSRRKSTATFVALACWAGITVGLPRPAPAQDDLPPPCTAEVETLQGVRTVRFQRLELTPSPRLIVLESGDAALAPDATSTMTSMDLREVLRLAFAPPVPYRRELRVTLADGSVLFGGLGPGTDDTQLAFNGRLFPDGVSIPLEWVRQIEAVAGSDSGVTGTPVSRPRAMDEAAAEDRLATREGAQLSGLMLGVSAEVVRFEDHKLGKLELPWANVQSIAIASLEPAPVLAPTRLSVTVDGMGGSYLHGGLTRLDTSGLELESVLLGVVRLPIAAVSSVEFRLGRVEYLSDRTPIRVSEVGPVGLGFHWPWQRNANAYDGGPLQIGNRTFRRGLGVHSECRLTFTIEPGDERFQAWIGIDATGRPANGDPEFGSVVFVVKVDGVEKFRSGDVNWERSAQQIEVSLAGGKELELIVECGQKFYILDRADWGDARILKK
ncbi:MAG: NPCBM/NEW2 domain-containing protein [Planctomycetota bacterium]